MTTLTKQQKLQTLNKGKRKHEKAPKIVLCNPFPKYWPQVNDDLAETIGNLLNVLIVSERKKPKLSWKEIINLPKEMRKQRMKEKYTEEGTSEELLRQRKCLKLGLNSVSRALQHMSIQSCLLAGDVENDIMISHLVTLACARGIPVLIVPKMKEITYKILGFSTIAIGVKVTDDEKYFRSLNDTISKLSLQFPIPPQFSWIRNKSEQTSNEKLKPMKKRRCAVSIPEECEMKEDFGNFFVDRRPESKEIQCSSHFKSSNSSDFIPITSETETKVSEDVKNQLYNYYINNIFYLAPKFKKMQKNSNRCRDKLLSVR